MALPNFGMLLAGAGHVTEVLRNMFRTLHAQLPFPLGAANEKASKEVLPILHIGVIPRRITSATLEVWSSQGR